MKINEAIKSIMRADGVRQSMLATMIGAKSEGTISSRLSTHNLSAETIIEMLEPMGYELVIQKKLPGTRPRDQIVIERSEKK